MRITEKQERILESLHCERLSSNVDNFRLVDDFYNGRNPVLSIRCKMRPMRMMQITELLIMWLRTILVKYCFISH